MNDDHLRNLLEDAVSDVEPRHGLDTIRSRTADPPARRPWVWGVGGAVLATAATIAAFAVLSNDPGTTDAEPDFVGSPTPSESGPVDPGRTASTERPEQPEPAPTETTVPVYFVGDTSRGVRLFREFQTTTEAEPAVGAAQLSVDGAAADVDYGSRWPAGTKIDDVSFDDGVITIRLGATPVADRPAGMSAEQASLSVQQLVYTVQGVFQSRAGVDFYVGGQRVETVLGEPTTRGTTARSADDVLAQVWITSPSEGATVSSPFEVEGLAAAFEANVQWELMQGDTVVRQGYTTAQECCTMSPYSFRVTAPPGEYTLVVHDEDASGGEGLPPWQDTKQIEVVD